MRWGMHRWHNYVYHGRHLHVVSAAMSRSFGSSRAATQVALIHYRRELVSAFQAFRRWHDVVVHLHIWEHMRKEHEVSLRQAVAKEAGQTNDAVAKLKKLRKEMTVTVDELETVKRDRTQIQQQLKILREESNREVARLQGLLEKARLALERSIEEKKSESRATRQQSPSSSEVPSEDEDEESPSEEYESLLLDKIEEAAASKNNFWGKGMDRMAKSPPGRRHKVKSGAAPAKRQRPKKVVDTGPCRHCEVYESAHDVLSEGLRDAREELSPYRELGESRFLSQTLLEATQHRVQIGTLREDLQELQEEHAELSRIHEAQQIELSAAMSARIESEAFDTIIEANAALAEREARQEEVIARLRGRVQLLEARLNRGGVRNDISGAAEATCSQQGGLHGLRTAAVAGFARVAQSAGKFSRPRRQHSLAGGDCYLTGLRHTFTHEVVVVPGLGEVIDTYQDTKSQVVLHTCE